MAWKGRMRKIDRLVVGSTVVFRKKPPGGWLSENVPYVVDFNTGKTVSFRDPITGSGTFDPASLVEYSAFTV
jgi:hypothetical protein